MHKFKELCMCSVCDLSHIVYIASLCHCKVSVSKEYTQYPVTPRGGRDFVFVTISQKK